VPEFTLGSGVLLPDDRGLYSLIDDGARVTPDLPVLSRLTAAGWQDVTYRELDADARRAATVLVASGVAEGDRVGILGRTSYEWVVAELAVLAIGAVTVPIFPTASAVQAAHIVTDSAMAWCFTETAEQGDMVAAASAGALRARPWPLAAAAQPTWAGETPAAGSDGAAAAEAELERRRARVRANSLATIVYTSGTTGMPKGCMLTHGNLFASSANTVEHTGDLFRSWPLDQASDAERQDAQPQQSSLLLCLPLAHVFGQTSLFACLYAGTRTGLLPGVGDLLPAMATFRPTMLVLVPYGLEKIRKGLRAVLDAQTEHAAVAVGLRDGASQAPAGGSPTGEWSLDARAAALARARAMFGGRLDYVISGGASLDATTEAFYRGVGVRILNCYGLTEAATAVTVNQPATNRIGTVGQPIPGTTVAIAPDGEVLVAGPNVSPGYWPAPVAPDATRWLHTGDLGTLDEDGFLVITGRRKDILITSGGKNVTPTLLEDRMRLHPLVADSMVVGEGRPYVAALVTTEPAALARLAAAHDIDLDAPGWWEHPAVTDAVAAAVDDANSLVSRAESIRRFRVLPSPFTVDDGHLTPSMKLRRAPIEAAFAAEIDELYAPAPATPVPATS